MASGFPTDAGSITADWLSAALGSRITAFSVTPLDSGVASDVYRLHDLVGTAGGDLPASLVLKVASQWYERRQFAVACNLYGREVSFFRALAASTPVRSPKVYACEDDGQASPVQFAILMEDLTAHSSVVDQVDEPGDEEFATKLARQAARLHAHYWQYDVTTLPWLAGPGSRYVFPLDALCRSGPASLPLFTSLWSKTYGDDLFDAGPFAEAAPLVERLCGPSSDRVLDGIYAVLSSRPKTVLHGDLRADNVFRTNGSQEDVPDHSELTFIDWQLVHAGPPGLDLAEALVASFEPGVRRAEHRILRAYHDALVELRPDAAAYTYAMLVEDYTLGACLWLTTFITAGAATLPSFDQPGTARMKRLWEKMVHRALTAVIELECLSAVTSILDE
jgi:hypothetical protein